MTISRAQMRRQLYMNGGITNLIEPRQEYGLGSLVKSVKKAVKGAVGGIKDIVSSDVGKLALMAAGGYYLGGGNLFGLQRAGMSGFSLGNLPGAGFLGKAPAAVKTAAQSFAGKDLLTKGGTLLTGTALLTSLFGSPQQAQEMYQRDPNTVRKYLAQYYQNINPNADPMQIDRFVESQMSEYTAKQELAYGGRAGFEEGGGEFMTMEELQENYPGMTVNEGGDEPSNLMQLIQKYYTFKEAAPGVDKETREYMYDILKNEAEAEGVSLNELVRFSEEQSPIYNTREGKMGGGMPTGIMKANQAGVMERDYRETGGFVPVGIKEKADDVPAMLSKNEFVFTADAVRGAGNGDVENGAQKLYTIMKTLENGGRV